MQRYLVFMPNHPEVPKSRFPHHHELGPGLCAVGSELLTCSDVHEHLGLGTGRAGVVVKITEFYGHFDGALWQRLGAWSEM